LFNRTRHQSLSTVLFEPYKTYKAYKSSDLVYSFIIFILNGDAANSWLLLYVLYALYG